MSVLPSAVVFDYDEFPPVPPGRWEGSELQQSLILAGVLAAHLADGGALVPGRPIDEDCGAVLRVVGPEGGADIVISFYPRDSSDFGWALQFREVKGLLRSLFAKPDDERILAPVKESIASLFTAHPDRFRNAEWMAPSKLWRPAPGSAG